MPHHDCQLYISAYLPYDCLLFCAAAMRLFWWENVPVAHVWCLGVVVFQVKTNTAKMSSKRAKGKITKKRPQRATSNVFAMFDQSQIQEFKEAFNMIDQNRDGFVDKEDLHDMLASLGKASGSLFMSQTPRILFWFIWTQIYKLNFRNYADNRIFTEFVYFRKEPKRWLFGGDDDRSSGSYKLHYVSHYVWWETERHRSGGRHPKCICLLRWGRNR